MITTNLLHNYIDISKKNVLHCVNFPILLIFFVQIFAFIENQNSEIYVSTLHQSKLSTIFIIVWLIFLLFAVLRKIKYIPLRFAILLFFFLILSSYNLFNSYNFNAALESFLKMMFPILGVAYGITHKEKFKEYTAGLFWLVIANNTVQIFVFILHFTGLAILKLRIEQNFLIRSEGLLDFVSFGTMNFVAAILVHHYFNGRYKNFFWGGLIFCSITSFAFKLYPLILIYIFFISTKKIINRTIIIFILLIVSFFYNYTDSFIVQTFKNRAEMYSLSGDSIRAQSYQVAYKSIFENNNFFGEGLGTFGGPSSMKYNSPTYRIYNFNFGRLDYLATTDTYYPHPLVEQGLVGFLLLFLLILYPILMKGHSEKIGVAAVFVLLILFNNSFTAFTMEDPTSVMYLITLIPMLIHQNNRLNL